MTRWVVLYFLQYGIRGRQHNSLKYYTATSMHLRNLTSVV